jgi:hypothetical protein
MTDVKDVVIANRLPSCDGFIEQVFQGVPLADAVLSLQSYLLQPDFLNGIFEAHRGRCYEALLEFSLFVELLSDALQKHGGSARQSLVKAEHEGRLTTTTRAFYGKLSRLPVEVSQALVVEAGLRLQPLLPDVALRTLPASLSAFGIYMVDGKKLKNAAKRLLVTRGYAGKLFGGKLLVAWQPTTGLAFAMSAHLDGEKNDSPLMPALLPQVAHALPGPRLGVADRQFCDLVQIERWRANGDHYLLRYHPKLTFHPDPARPTQTTTDERGRKVLEEWGWLGVPSRKERPYVRRITLQRGQGDEDIILVTDLLDAAAYPATDLLAVYALRWRIECVFQQITEIFSLDHLIASTPQGTIFQAAFCLILYNMTHVIRSYVAHCQEKPLAVEDVSTEMLFLDIRGELIGLHLFATPLDLAALIPPTRTSEQMRDHLRRLLTGLWRPLWRKAVNKKPRPKVERAKKSGAHTSVFRILQKHRSSTASG